MEKKADIRKMSQEELMEAVAQMGEKPFRGKQIYEWLWSKRARSFDDMTNLSQEFRERLKEKFEIYFITIADKQISSDGTIKYAFKLREGHVVEGVLIPTGNRTTACISGNHKAMHGCCL